jgi:WD40 repeat protein
LTNLSSKTNVCISPNEKLVLTGTSVRKGFGHGMIMAYDVEAGDLVDSLAISDQSVVSIVWHKVINQIVVGSADANIRVLYDPKLSNKGIMSCIVKQEKRRPVDSMTTFSRPVYTPSTFEDEREKEMEKDPFNPNN